jgi:hypothetical protein
MRLIDAGQRAGSIRVRRPSASLVVASLALFVALAGVSSARSSTAPTVSVKTIYKLQSEVAALRQTLKGVARQGNTLRQTLKGVTRQGNTLRQTLKGVSRQGNTLRFSGVNVQIVNGEPSAGSLNGLGNLIVGYNRDPGTQTGSGNVVIGDGQTFTSYGGFVAGLDNSLKGPDSSILGGYDNTVSGTNGAVGGGTWNDAGANAATVAGGLYNYADENGSGIFGGCSNLTGAGPAPTFVCSNQDYFDDVFGGYANAAEGGNGDTVIGGNHNVDSKANNTSVAAGS